MKSKIHFRHIIAGLFLFPLIGAFTSASAITIRVIGTFDYPGTGNLTEPQKVNDTGDIAGLYVDSSGVTRGFFFTHGGNFSAPIVEPNDTIGFTQGRGLNNTPTFCGDYIGSDGLLHGFFLDRNRYTEFDVPDSQGTEVLGINNAGDFVGNFVALDGSNNGYVSIGGTISSFTIAGSSLTALYQINSSNQSVGYYADSGGITHGILRDSDGTLTFPIDPPGSTGTILFGNNDKNWVVGRYSDSSGVTHGLFFIPPDTFVTYDYPGSAFTSLNGISKEGYVCGRYVDSAGIEHGILGRVVRDSEGNAAVEKKTNSRPAATGKIVSPPASTVPAGAPAS